MSYAIREVLEFVKQNDVKFIRLAFCDIFGTQKNISIMPDELERAFKEGVSFDASAIKGFGDVVNSDLLLFPDPSTLNVLPTMMLPALVSSGKPITESMDVSLREMINWLMIEGTIVRIACGRITFCIALP